MNDESRPKAAHGTPAGKSEPTIQPDGIPAQLRRRCSTARRLPPVEGRRGPRDLAVYDPALIWPVPPAGPCTYGLDEVELAAEARRLHAAGWAAWELAAVLDLPGLAGWALAK